MEKINIKDFVDKYNNIQNEETKKKMINSIISNKYIPIIDKYSMATVMIKKSFSSINGEEKINSVVRYMNYCTALLVLYTNFNFEEYSDQEENTSSSYKIYDLLKSNKLLIPIIELIDPEELNEFKTIFELVYSDMMQNNFNTEAYINRQVTRFGSIFGGIVGKISEEGLQKLADKIENFDEKKANKILISLDKFINKLNK